MATSNYFNPLTTAQEDRLLALIKPKLVNLVSSEYYEEQYQKPAAHQSYDTGLTIGEMSNVVLSATQPTKQYVTTVSGGQGHITDIWLEVTPFNTTAGIAGTFSEWWPYLIINEITVRQGQNYLFQNYNPIYWFMYTISRLPRELRTRLFQLTNQTAIPAGVAIVGAPAATQILVLPMPWSRIWSGGRAQPALHVDGWANPGIQMIFKFNPINFFASAAITSMFLEITPRTQVILYRVLDDAGDPPGVTEEFNVPFENIAPNETIYGPTVGSVTGITIFNTNLPSCVLNFLSYIAKGIYLAAQKISDVTANPPQYFRGAFPSNFKYAPKGSASPAVNLSGISLQMVQLLQELTLRPWSPTQDIAPGSGWTPNFAWFFGANNDPNDIFGLWNFTGTNSSRIGIEGVYPVPGGAGDFVWLTPCAIVLQVLVVKVNSSGLRTMEVAFGAEGNVGV